MTTAALLLSVGLGAGFAPAASAAASAPSTVAAPTSALPAAAGCTATLSSAERAALLTASDTLSLREAPDALARIKTINSILAAKRDARGVFPVFYEAILERTVHVMNTEHFNDPVWSKKIAIEFVSEYLRNLHGHLSGGAVTAHCQESYSLVSDCRRTPGRVAAQGPVAHMVDDFPRALLTVGTTQANYEDFLHYGDALIAATPTIVERVKRAYGTDLQPLFSLYMLGEIFGPSRVTTAFFTSVRSLAWNNFVALKASRIVGLSKISVYWTTARTLILGYEAQGKL